MLIWVANTLRFLVYANKLQFFYSVWHNLWLWNYKSTKLIFPCKSLYSTTIWVNCLLYLKIIIILKLSSYFIFNVFYEFYGFSLIIFIFLVLLPPKFWDYSYLPTTHINPHILRSLEKLFLLSGFAINLIQN